MRLAHLFGLSASLLAVAACSGRTVQESSNGGTSSACLEGTERCACYGNNTCNQGLECHSDICVAMGTGGSASNGSTPGTGGSKSGSGGASSVGIGGVVGVGGIVGIGGIVGVGGALAAGGAKVAGGSPATGAQPSAGGSPVATGGKTSAQLSAGGASAATGGKTSAASGGSSSLPILPVACPGLPISTSAAGAGATDPDAGPQCAGIGIELEPSPLDMFIMMDRTASMTYTVQNTALERWDVLQQGVQQFVNDPTVQTRAPRVGLGFFGATGNPNDPTECDPVTYTKPKIEIEPLATSGPKILQAVIDERALLGGQTPWMPSLQGALMHAQDWQTANPARQTVVVMITDGYPTECDQDISHIQEMMGEYYAGVQGTYNTKGAPGVRTYIIGVAVDKFNLDAVAQAGGTRMATIVDSTGAVDQFVTALTNITNSDTTCTIALPSPPAGQVFDPFRTQVVFRPFQGTNQELPMAASAAGCSKANGGWYFDNPLNPTRITLCPCSCANLGSGGMEIRFGCMPTFATN